MERLAREKIATQQRLAELKNELSQCMDVVEIDRVLRQTIQPEDDQASTSTASGRKQQRLEQTRFHILGYIILLRKPVKQKYTAPFYSYLFDVKISLMQAEGRFFSITSIIYCISTSTGI